MIGFMLFILVDVLVDSEVEATTPGLYEPEEVDETAYREYAPVPTFCS